MQLVLIVTVSLSANSIFFEHPPLKKYLSSSIEKFINLLVGLLKTSSFLSYSLNCF